MIITNCHSGESAGSLGWSNGIMCFRTNLKNVIYFLKRVGPFWPISDVFSTLSMIYGSYIWASHGASRWKYPLLNYLILSRLDRQHVVICGHGWRLCWEPGNPRTWIRAPSVEQKHRTENMLASLDLNLWCNTNIDLISTWKFWFKYGWFLVEFSMCVRLKL